MSWYTNLKFAKQWHLVFNFKAIFAIVYNEWFKYEWGFYASSETGLSMNSLSKWNCEINKQKKKVTVPTLNYHQTELA